MFEHLGMNLRPLITSISILFFFLLSFCPSYEGQVDIESAAYYASYRILRYEYN